MLHNNSPQSSSNDTNDRGEIASFSLVSFRRSLLLLNCKALFIMGIASTILNLIMGIFDEMLLMSTIATIGSGVFWRVSLREDIPTDHIATYLLIAEGLFVSVGWFLFAGVRGGGPTLLFAMTGATLQFSTQKKQSVALLFVLGMAGVLHSTPLLMPMWIDPYYTDPTTQMFDIMVANLLGVAICGGLFLKMSWHHLRGWEVLVRKQKTVVTLARQKAEWESQNLKDRLAATQALGNSLAHDVNNMLTVVLASIEMMEADEESELQEEAITSTLTASRLVQRFRMYSRESVEIFSIGLLLKSLCASISNLASHIDFQLNLPESDIKMTGYPVEIEQIVMNLCLNAVQAMPDSGRLLIQAIPQNTSHLCIWIEDNGIGIHPDDLPHIFDAFYTTKKQSGGTGIGLNTVQGLVHQWNGTIEVHSTLGKGTIFTVTLPISQAL